MSELSKEVDRWLARRVFERRLMRVSLITMFVTIGAVVVLV